MAMQSEKKISIYDYPEHLNPFHENDHKLRFWNMTKSKLRRSSFSDGFKEFKRTWSFKSLTRRGRKDSTGGDSASVNEIPDSPIMYRSPGRASTMSRTSRTPEETNRYLYGGSVTPLPRFRFQERGSLSDYKQVNGNNLSTASDDFRRTSAPGGSTLAYNQPMTNGFKTDSKGSQTSLQSNNPFETSVGSIRSSARKKRRAPLPPSKISSVHDTPCITVTDTASNTTILEENARTVEKDGINKDDIDVDHPSLNIELRIIEDSDESKDESNNETNKPIEQISDTTVNENITEFSEKKESLTETPSSQEVEIMVIEKTYQTDVAQNVKSSENEKDDNKDSSEMKINESVQDSLIINEDQTIEKINNEQKTQQTNNDEADNKLVESNTANVEIAINTTADEKNIKNLDNKPDTTETVNLQDNLNNEVRKETATAVLDAVFKKVDIVTYSRKQSVDVEAKLETDKNDLEQKSTDTVNGVNNQSEDGQEDNKNVSETKTVIVKYGYIGYPDSTEIIKENARRRSEFFELDKTELENEVEVRDKTTSDNGNYQRRRVSDMKLLFDNPSLKDASLVNPIPKPRRSKSTNKSTSESITNGEPIIGNGQS